jgi:hypothetical protein
MYNLLHNVQTGYGVNTASYPMVTRELPKGIKWPKREADNSLRPRAEVKNARAYSPPQRPDLLWRQKSFLSNGCSGTSQGIKRPKREADNSLRPRAEVKNARATGILSSTRSRPAMAPTQLPIQYLQGNFPRG